MVKSYNELSEGSKNKHANFLERLHKSGLTTMDVRQMSKDGNWKGLKTALGSKGNKASIEGLFRLNNQITMTPERKENNVKRALKTYENNGFRGKGLRNVEKQLIKTNAQTFFAIAKDLQKKFKETKKQSYKHARDLLKVPESRYDLLDVEERLVLADYDY